MSFSRIRVELVKVKPSYKVLLIAFFITSFNVAFSQAPQISYQTPQIFYVNNAIPALAPANTGGAVPATIYGEVTTYAGTGSFGSTNGTALNASFGNPTRLTIDINNNIYVADRDNNKIRKISSTGVVSTLSSGLFQPNGVTIDPAGNIFVADAGSNSIKKITPQGNLSTYAGDGQARLTNGPASNASFSYPYAVVNDTQGSLFVADAANNAIRKISAQGIVSTVAGNGSVGFANGNGSSALFRAPNCVALDAQGNIYVSDPGNNMIRKISNGVVSTFAGSLSAGSANGASANATFNNPCGVCLDAAGNTYVADLGNNQIRKIDKSGMVSTLAGSGNPGATNGIGTTASFNKPNDVQSDNKGYLFVTDYGNSLIRKICITGYTIDKALPPGLSFDPTTGIITGTPTAIFPPTDYTVTAYNAQGSSSTVVNIQVISLAALVFPALPAKTICDADFAPGAISNGPAVSYTSSNTSVATIIANKIHVTGAGTTVITATAGTNTLQQTLTVTSPAVPALTIAADFNSVCEGFPVTFTATLISGGGSDPAYNWLVNGIPAGVNSNTFTVTTLDKTDKVKCEVTNDDICPVTGTSNSITGIIFEPYTSPAISITSSADGIICSGSLVTFTADYEHEGANPIFQWQINGIDAGANNPVFSTNSLTDGDIVTCTLTNTAGACLVMHYATSNSITVNVAPITNPAPSVEVTASENKILEGTAVTFTAEVFNAGSVLSYQWLIDGNPTEAQGNTFTTNTLKNNEKVTCMVRVQAGCTVSLISETYTVEFIAPETINIPNTFTPNGDGINDVWNISDLSYYTSCSVTVYNRLGNIVFQSIGYGRPWDGTFKGQQVPVATYYYLIETARNKERLKGSITVIR